MDRIHQDWEIFRVDLQGGATLFPSNDAAVASELSEFFGMVYKSYLINWISHSPLKGSMNYLDVIAEISKIKAYWVDGILHLNQMTPLQEEIFDYLNIMWPSEALFKKKHL